MRLFFDSSAYAKRFIDEPGSDAVDQLLRDATALGLSVLCQPELLSALNRRRREGSLSTTQYDEAKRRLAEEIADAQVVDLGAGAVAEATRLLEAHPLRALDALHLACAVEWRAGLFVTADLRQADAAEGRKLRVRRV